MDKLVVLELDGDLKNQGFRVTLEIRSGDNISDSLMKLKGKLPVNPQLAQDLQFHWQEKYRNLEITTRIKTKNIIHKSSIHQRISDCLESANQLSFSFQKWLQAVEFREINLRLREELDRHETIQFLICSEDKNIQKLPWQQWDFFERYPKAEVGFSRLESKSSQKLIIPNQSKTSVQVLAIFGHQTGIDVETDLQLLKNLENIELTLLIAPNHHQITHQLWEKTWDIIFFAGHSETQDNTGIIHINSTDSLTISELYYGFQKAVKQGLKLAIFNSCDGFGLAVQLYDLQIPQMIVMRELVPDRIAQEFLKHFFKSFTNYQPLYLAVREARQRLHDDFEREFPCASWLPVIVQQPTTLPLTWNQLLGNNNLSASSSLKKQRILAAVMFTDAVRFSARMATQEEQTIALIERDLTLMKELCHRFEGKVLKTTGDGLLMYFLSATQAANCAIEIQTMLLKNSQLPSQEKLFHRIGIHLGEVFFRDGDIIGNGVNIAARLESIAEPGGILISQAVYEVVKNKLTLEINPLGFKILKNIPSPIQVYQIKTCTSNYEKFSKKPTFKVSLKKYLFVLSNSLIVTILVIGLRSLGLLQNWELQTFDLFLQWRPQEAIDPRLLVIEATESDINQYGFPLPDSVLAKTLENLQKHDPKIIALDIFRDRPVGEGYSQLLNQFQTYQNLIGVCSAMEANKPNKPGIKPPSKLPESRLGFTDVVVDKDSILRRHLLFMQPVSNDPCITNYAFSSRVALTYLASQGIEPKLISKEQIQIGSVIFNDIEINFGAYQKFDRGGFQILLNYRKQLSKTVKLSEVLSNKTQPDLIKDKIILIGITAPISGDEFLTPYSAIQEGYPKTPGILIQAQKVSQIISAVLDNRPLLNVWNRWGESFWIWGWSMIGGLLASKIKRQWLWSLATGIILFFLLGFSFYLFLQGIWVAVIPPAIVMIISGQIIWLSRKFYQGE